MLNEEEMMLEERIQKKESEKEGYRVEDEIRSVIVTNLDKMKGDSKDTVMYHGDTLRKAPWKLADMLENCETDLTEEEVIGFIDQKSYSTAVAFTLHGVLFRKDPGRTEIASTIGETIFLRYDEIAEVKHLVRGIMKQEYLRFVGDFSTCDTSVCEMWLGCCGRTDLDWIRMKYCLEEIMFLMKEAGTLHTLEEFKEARLKRSLMDDLEEEDEEDGPLDVSTLRVLKWSSEEVILGFPESERENVEQHERSIKYALYLLGVGGIELAGFLGMFSKEKKSSLKVTYQYD